MSIKLQHITYQYESQGEEPKKAIDDISLEIKPGEFIGIIGHTGSGKSTLIQHFNGLLKATSGSYYFDGEDVYSKGFSIRDLCKKVGFSFQYPEYQLFEATVLDDVCFGPKNMGLTRTEQEKRAREALEAVGIPKKYEMKSPFLLSGGEKRRVAIAGVLAMEPQYFILDEPTAGLDPIGRKKILDLLKRLWKEKGMTIILVSHSMEDIADYATRVLVMKRGKLLMDGTPKEIFGQMNKMQEAGLSVPDVTKCVHMLNERGFSLPEDITQIGEAKDAILAELGEKVLLSSCESKAPYSVSNLPDSNLTSDIHGSNL